jgi:protein SCO1/2
MSRKTIFYISFFTVLVIGFFVALAAVVPGFAEKKLVPIAVVKPFSFVNQDGQAVTQEQVNGKVYVSEFFFTTCKSICPRMNTNLKQVYERFRNEPDFLILSHTCDPETDSPEKLKQYSDSLKVNTAKWIFLTGRKDSLYNMARHSYRIDDPNNHVKDIKDDFLHSQHFALVNKKGEVVQVVDGLKKDEIREMNNRIAKLLEE